MIMNNIIFFGDGNYGKGHCSLTATMTNPSADANENCYKNFRMNYRCCVEIAYSSLTQSVQGSVYMCFQDLEKLRKAQTTTWTF